MAINILLSCLRRPIIGSSPSALRFTMGGTPERGTLHYVIVRYVELPNSRRRQFRRCWEHRRQMVDRWGDTGRRHALGASKGGFHEKRHSSPSDGVRWAATIRSSQNDGRHDSILPRPGNL